jgi:hypothetical protein
MGHPSVHPFVADGQPQGKRNRLVDSLGRAGIIAGGGQGKRV